MRVRRLLAPTVVLALLAGCGGGPASGGAAGGAAKPRAFPVEVAPVAERDLAYTIRAVGSLEAFERVPVTARVAGVIERIAVVEGDRVVEGAVIAEIDPARYRLERDVAVADLARAKAGRDEAAAATARREALAGKGEGLVSAEELAAARARNLVAEAEVAQAEAHLHLAEVDLEHATVRAPVPGVVQDRSATTGQYAQPGTVIAGLLRIDPLLARFQVPADQAVALKAGMRFAFTTPGIPGDQHGVITHVAAGADQKTRMVEVIGRVEPADAEHLRPGAFTEVTVPVGGGRAPVVPETAIRPSEDGFLAFVVDGDAAHRRVLQIGLHTEDGQVEVRSGLAVGERLVVRGAEALSEGAPVREGGRQAPGRPSAAKPADGKPGDAKPTDPKPADPKPAEGAPAKAAP